MTVPSLLSRTSQDSPRLGVGVITYNRQPRLAATLAALLLHQSVDCVWVVADDGSTDGTASFVGLQYPEMTLVTGQNRGVAWNRNRALWQLYVVERCDVVLLIEDDACPDASGWEADWIRATLRHGHVNLAGEWFKAGFVRGAGTPTDPVLSQGVSGQVSAFRRDALDYVGFYDTRFRGYGMAHVEHSLRLIRAGYGGEVVLGKVGDFDLHQLGKPGAEIPTSLPEALFYLLRSPIVVNFAASHASPEAETRNRARAVSIVHDQVYRAPWSCDGEMIAFRSEMAAVAHSPKRQVFPMQPPSPASAPGRILVREDLGLSLREQINLVQIAHEGHQPQAAEWAVRTLERSVAYVSVFATQAMDDELQRCCREAGHA